jgi:mannan endo-1,4-beta-mannosidase
VNFFSPAYRRAAVLAATLAVAGAQAAAQPASLPVPDAMADQPEAQDFISKSPTGLMLLGNMLRFGGLNVSWLGLRSDGAADLRVPTPFEVKDVFTTANAMGVGYIRVVSLVAPAGCALCLTPAPGQLNAQALAHADHLLRLAHDAGIKIVVPLAGAGHCDGAGDGDPVNATQCVFARAQGLGEAGFYADPAVRADFVRFVTTLLRHINPETGLAWNDDPTIMAWENCDDCGAGMDPAVLADWSEFLGQAIKSVDHHHLYENGAFAGRLGQQPGAVDGTKLALPSVDMIGDRVAPRPGSPANFADAAQQAVSRAGAVYVIDSYAWAPSHWATAADFEAFLAALVDNRAISGAFASDLGGHADKGGWLPPTRADDPVLYFPAAPEGSMDQAAMAARVRAVRRLSYQMMDLEIPAFANPEPPEIISADHGKLAWRGSAGSVSYSIERTTDLTQTGAWTVLCDRCVSDADPHWQDPSAPGGKVWYRMTPYNANMHIGLPSAPALDQRP